MRAYLHQGLCDNLAEAGFVDIVVEPKPESRKLVREWAPGLGVEDSVASAVIQARKPTAL